MVIDKKFVYIKKKEIFEQLISSIPQGLNPIVFIEDTREMWTCGTYFSIGLPSIEVSEISGSIKVAIGNSFFLVSTAGESLSVREGEGNRIILSSNALNKIDTKAPLEWNQSDKKLYHMVSGVTPGSYGQSTNLGNASVFSIPNVTVDSTGHVISITNRNVEIRDYVEQQPASTSLIERSVLLSNSEVSDSVDVSPVRKANGMTYNDNQRKLTVEGGITSNGAVNINNSDLTVTDGYIIGTLKGDVTGEAVPKIHLSSKPEYGGASTETYGHVKVQDALTTKPNSSSNNTDINNMGVVAIAASPLMVWEAVENMKTYINEVGIKVHAQDVIHNNIDISSKFTFGTDFVIDEDKEIHLRWKEI